MGQGGIEVGCCMGKGGYDQCTDSTGYMDVALVVMGVVVGLVACGTGLETGLDGEIGFVAGYCSVLPQGTVDTCPPHGIHRFHLPLLGMGRHTVGVLGRLDASANVVVGNDLEYDLALFGVDAAALPLFLSRSLAVE